MATNYRDDRELDRRDSDACYSPENCRWVPKIVNLTRRALPRDGRYIEKLTGDLTSQIVEQAHVRQRAYKLFDGQGLHLYVAPTGAKSWRFKYRFAGREKLLTLGRYPDLSIEDARELHLVAKMRVKAKRDPAIVKHSNVQRRANAGGISPK